MAQSEQDEVRSNESLRAQAEALLAQAYVQLANIQQARDAVGDGALQSRLTESVAPIAGAINVLFQALDGPAFALRQVDLIALRNTVQSDQVRSLVVQAAAQAGAPAPLDLAAASAATRTEIQTLAHDIFGRRIFAAYLRFDSAEDEEAFRRREAEAQKYIDAQLARGTAEGTLNAGGGMLGYMLDAHAHGAGDSPDFMPRWAALVDKLERQRAAMHAAGQSTEEYDRNLRASVRLYLKEKAGLSDVEIDAHLAASANPLDVVKPLLGRDRDSRVLENQVRRASHIDHAATLPSPRIEAGGGALIPNAPPTVDFSAMTTKLKAAVIQTAANDDDPHHGLTVQKPAGKPGPDGPG